MDDISAIDGLTNSLRAVADITRALKDVGDPSAIPTKIYELAAEIVSAQSCALAVQAEQFDLAKSKRELEAEIVSLKAWNTERYRYQLQSVGSGANAYVVKDTMRGSEPVHWICVDCFQSGKKRFLNENSPSPPSEPMTLGNMRANGVRSLAVTCQKCQHERIINADKWTHAGALLRSTHGLHEMRSRWRRRAAELAGARDIAGYDAARNRSTDVWRA